MAITDRNILPDAVKPSNYALSLYDLELGGSFTYQGTVKINVAIAKPTKEIELNALQLQIHDAEIFLEHSKTQESIKTSNVSYDDKLQRVMLLFPAELQVCSNALVVVTFSGIMNNTMTGFYRSKYKPTTTPVPSVPKDDEFHYMFSTQFESCDARRAFPCFDEPNLKASFDIEIEIPEDQVALSNMPEKETKESRRAGRKVLLAWAFGDFEYIEDHTKRTYNGKHLPVRVYTTKGLKEQGQFALRNAHQVIDFFSEIFHIDYPLPKADLLAVHEFSYGAMENWGLVTYRTTAVLFDESQSDQKYKTLVAYVVAHELAHQWFGNLVTMEWWSELWLNEGFATWVGWLAVDHLYPGWNVWGRFVTESVQTAFQLDSLRGSHPIEVPVKDALEIDQIFDSISYLKGSSIIRMLSGHLGADKFLLGVSSYLKAHAYGNATTSDLWAALSQSSGQDVHNFMDNWIRKIGFPVLTVAEEPGQIGVRQSRFLLTGDVMSDEDETTWWVPLGLKANTGIRSHPMDALQSKEQTIRNIDESFYKLNANQTGFYRTNYPPERLAKLGVTKGQLSVEDKVGLIGDAAALAISGYGTTAGLLAFVEHFRDEKDYLVWAQMLASVTNVRSIFADDEVIATALKKFTLSLVTSATDKMGWEFGEDEDFLTSELRALLIKSAGGAGHQGVISEARHRFELYESGKDKRAIHKNLRSAVFGIVVREGHKSEYEALKQEYLSTLFIDGKEICLQALGGIQTPDLAHDFLDFVFSDRVAIQDVHFGTASLAANSKCRGILWQYIKDNWQRLRDYLSAGNSIVFDRFLKLSLTIFSNHEVERDIAAFFEGKDNKGYERTLTIISDTVRAHADYRDRDAATLLEWLKTYGYA
ncbi:MAG: hypothetical protein M1827_002060 [Pycnora praestabilis]|nr:MAG: hypothetical protein M1827_002060 [Pycnora praestabilis]